MGTPIILNRASFGWGACVVPNANTNLGMVAHYDGANQGLVRKGHPSCAEYWKWCREFHMEKRGWSDIGYAYGVCPHGYIFVGRGYGKTQAAQKTDSGGIANGNSRYVSVTFMTGPDEEITERAIQGFRALRTKLMREYGMKGDVYGHRDFSQTSCPGGALYALVRSGTLTRADTASRPTLRVTDPMMRGEAVREAQRILGVTVDGWYGPDTAKAVRKFQRAHDLDDDGIIGARTWPVLLKGK